MSNVVAPRPPAAEPFYLFRAVVMAMLHLIALAGLVDTPAVEARLGLLTWCATACLFTAGWVLVSRVGQVRAKPLASLAGLGAEWSLALLAAAMVAAPFALLRVLMN